MTTGRFEEVDLDLLADYLGGVLDGTPEEAVVARLVAEDAAWAQAEARLAPALSAVGADLAAWGADAPEMPSDVADRITAALAAPYTPTDPSPLGLAQTTDEQTGVTQTGVSRSGVSRSGDERVGEGGTGGLPHRGVPRS
ncbi:hypothetical protein ABT336_25110, partial [Micromonospora sp. NPDC000207]